MANTLFPTTFTATTSADITLGTYLIAAGFTDLTNNSVTGQNGYIRNNSASINLLIGFGTTPPAHYASILPLSSMEFNAGMNVNDIWVKAASSTVSVDFVEGASDLVSPSITGVIGTITLADDAIPKGDGGNLVASNITDDGDTVTIGKDASFGGDVDVIAGNVAVVGSILSSTAQGGVGYATGAGGSVTQGTNRTTGVTINTVSGAITLISAAGSATPASFTVTNSTVAATDVVIVSQKSGTDLYEIFVTRVATGSFKITSFTTGGTTTEQPVFNFAVIKGVSS